MISSIRTAMLCAALALAAGPASAQLTGGGSKDMPQAKANPEILYRDGVKLLEAKNYAAAKSKFRELLDVNSSNGAGNFMMAMSEIGLGELDNARSHLRAAVKANPKSPDAHGRLGWVQAKLGDAKAAAEEREDLVKLQKKCAGRCPEAAGIDNGIALIDSVAAP